MAYAAPDGDPSTGRLASVSRYAGELEQTATWTMHYGVPVTGSEAQWITSSLNLIAS